MGRVFERALEQPPNHPQMVRLTPGKGRSHLVPRHSAESDVSATPRHREPYQPEAGAFRSFLMWQLDEATAFVEETLLTPLAQFPSPGHLVGRVIAPVIGPKKIAIVFKAEVNPVAIEPDDLV